MKRQRARKRAEREPVVEMQAPLPAGPSRAIEIACVVALLAAFVFSAGLQIASTSPTYDEPVHIAAGYSYARWGDYRLNPEHPPLVKRIAAIPLQFLGVTPADAPDVAHAEEPSLVELSAEWKAALADPSAEWTFAHNLFYGIRGSALARLGRSSGYQVEGTDAVSRADFLNDAARMVRASRWMIVPFGVALALLVYLWSRRLFGAAGALLSLTLLVFEPSMVAHSALVTTDVPIALCMFASAYFFWRATERFSWLAAVSFVVAAAAAFVVKFTAIVLVPLLLVLLLLRRTRSAVILVAAAALAAYVAIWAAYGWRYSAAADVAQAAADEQSLGEQRPMPALPGRLAGHFPLEYSLRRFAADARFFDTAHRAPTGEESSTAFEYASVRGIGGILQKFDRAHLLPEAYVYGAAFARERSVFRPSYLRGQYSDTGFGSYFLWTFLLKTPLIALVLIACGIVAATGPAYRSAARWLWIPVAIYLLFAVRANLNIGHRHLLPILPFLVVMCGSLASRWSRLARAPRIAVAAVVLTLVALSGLFVFAPSGVASVVSDRLAYVNELGGGPLAGYESLVDSNFDWGQDLPKLRAWLDQRGVNAPINLCYFGTADPRSYGIRHRNIAFGYEYEPDNGFYAVPGFIAVSATHLIGPGYDPKARAELRKFLADRGAREVGRAGYSILIYETSIGVR